ncbi:hypothetical protein EMPS_06213 [Entomortierella parvispora]|uniref:Uncharacterized protein n=1 Tax=Entomortierella parvispora TaxID=205924 RepID=A0A9P3LXH9_9FUNG|nr:hypothetical protein EMPS_06213 [Entomortierella parvispora]
MAGFHPHMPATRYSAVAKVLGASMWFWVMYKAKEEGPVVLVRASRHSKLFPLIMDHSGLPNPQDQNKREQGWIQNGGQCRISYSEGYVASNSQLDTSRRRTTSSQIDAIHRDTKMPERRGAFTPLEQQLETQETFLRRKTTSCLQRTVN